MNEPLYSDRNIAERTGLPFERVRYLVRGVAIFKEGEASTPIKRLKLAKTFLHAKHQLKNFHFPQYKIAGQLIFGADMKGHDKRAKYYNFTGCPIYKNNGANRFKHPYKIVIKEKAYFADTVHQTAAKVQEILGVRLLLPRNELNDMLIARVESRDSLMQELVEFLQSHNREDGCLRMDQETSDITINFKTLIKNQIKGEHDSKVEGESLNYSDWLNMLEACG